MSDQTTPTVGKLLQGTEGRDAIHFALAPVAAAEDLAPGQRVVLAATNRIRAALPGEMPIGIVDPFLEQTVAREERCWLFLMPNTITGLRHVWTHPAFAPKVPGRENTP